MERLDRLLMASAGLAPGALSFTFRPLWQMDAATKAATALQKAQATAIYAGLGLWPKPVMAGLVAGQLAEDGIYPDADSTLWASPGRRDQVNDHGYDPAQPRDPLGQWTLGGTTTSIAVGPEKDLPATALSTPLMGEQGRFSAGQGHSSSTEAQPSHETPRASVQVAANTTTTFKYACKKLKIDPIQASDALHAAKEALRLGGAAVCTFDLQTGDIIYNGEIIGNLRD